MRLYVYIQDLAMAFLVGILFGMLIADIVL